MRALTIFKKTIQYGLLSLLLLLALMTSLMIGLLFAMTTSEQLPNKIWPYLPQWTDQLVQIESSEGRLAKQLTLNQIKIQSPGLVIEIDQIKLRLNLFKLWRKKLEINQLDLGQVAIEIHTAESSAPSEIILPENPFELLRPWPLSTSVKSLKVNRLTLKTQTENDSDSAQINELEDIELAFDWQGSTIKLHNFTAHYQDHEINFHGHTQFLSDQQFQGELDTTLLIADNPPIELTVNWLGGLQALTFNTQLLQPFELNAEHQLAVQPNLVELISDWQAASWFIKTDQPLEIHQGQSTFSFQPLEQQLNLDGYLSWQWADSPVINQTYFAEIINGHLLNARLDSLTLENHALFAELNADLNQKTAFLNAEIRNLHLTPWLNSLLDLRSEFKTDLNVNGRFSAELFDFEQQLAELHLHTLDIQGLDQPLQISGKITSKAHNDWTHLHAEPFALYYGSHLGQVTLDMALNSKAEIRLSPSTLTLGNNHIKLSGQWPTEPRLDIDAQLNKLDHFWSELAGRANIQAQLGDDQQLKFNLLANNLRYQDIQLEQLQADLKTPWQQWAWLQGQVKLTQLTQQPPTVTKDSIVLIEQATIQRQAQSPGLVTQINVKHPDLQLNAQWQETNPTLNALNVRLDQFSVQTPHTGSWNLTHSRDLSWPPSADTTAPVCVASTEQTNALACFQFHTERQLSWSMQNWPLFDWIKPWTPDWIEAKGKLSGQGKFDWQPTANQIFNWRIEQQLLAEDWSFLVTQQGYEWPFKLDDLHFNLTADPKNAALTAKGIVNKDGELDIALELANQSESTALSAWSSAEIQGDISVTVNDWPLDKNIENIIKTNKVNLSLNSNLSGQLDQLHHDTQMQLTLLADLLVLGLNNQHLTATAQLDEQAISMTGRWQQALDKYADFTIQAKDLQSEPRFAGQVVSSSIQLLETEFATIQSAADLNWTFEQHLFKLRGDARLHDTHINLAAAPLHQRSTVSVDEVILDEDGQPLAIEQDALKTDLDINLHFDENVLVKLHDIQAMLGGQLRLLQAVNDKEMSGFGQVRFDSGEVKIDERNIIQIDRSLFNFNGTLANPNLNVTLSRKVDQTTARLNITGNTTQPQFVFYSTPPLSQGQIINLMIFGRAVDLDREPNYQSQVISAFYKLGLQNNTPVLNSLTQSLGIEDIYFDIQDNQSSNLILGRALTDKLYIRYALGLGAQRSNSVQMFYQLAPSLFFESQSNDESRSLDLIFRKER